MCQFWILHLPSLVTYMVGLCWLLSSQLEVELTVAISEGLSLGARILTSAASMHITAFSHGTSVFPTVTINWRLANHPSTATEGWGVGAAIFVNSFWPLDLLAICQTQHHINKLNVFRNLLFFRVYFDSLIANSNPRNPSVSNQFDTWHNLPRTQLRFYSSGWSSFSSTMDMVSSITRSIRTSSFSRNRYRNEFFTGNFALIRCLCFLISECSIFRIDLVDGTNVFRFPRPKIRFDIAPWWKICFI